MAPNSVFLVIASCQFLAILVSAVDHTNVSPGSYCYDNPACDASTWPGYCQTGKEQSPVNIAVSPLAAATAKSAPFKMNPGYLLESLHTFNAKNNGHTALFELNGNSSGSKVNQTICGGGLEDCYKFAQFHFHWAGKNDKGSEHTINGVSYPLELHLVHYKSRYDSLADALASKDRQAVAVIGVLFKIGLHNLLFNPFIDGLKKLQESGKVTPLSMSLRIANLVPEVGEFVRYLGSLTTPSCDEKVIWTVFLKPWDISDSQMQKFRNVSNSDGNSNFNYRPTQALNSRVVRVYRSGTFGLLPN